jgi:hypothetical protein
MISKSSCMENTSQVPTDTVHLISRLEQLQQNVVGIRLRRIRA